MFTFRGRPVHDREDAERIRRENENNSRFACGGYVPKPGPRPDPPRVDRKDKSRADAAHANFYRSFYERHGKTIARIYGGVIASLVRSAFYAGWHARKRAELSVAYGDDGMPARPTSDPRVAEAVLRAILAEGPVDVGSVHSLAAKAGVTWDAIFCAARRIARPWPRNGDLRVAHWELAENDFDSFLDAGIPNG
jgi:hypothetical protein